MVKTESANSWACEGYSERTCCIKDCGQISEGDKNAVHIFFSFVSVSRRKINKHNFHTLCGQIARSCWSKKEITKRENEKLWILAWTRRKQYFMRNFVFAKLQMFAVAAAIHRVGKKRRDPFFRIVMQIQCTRYSTIRIASTIRTTLCHVMCEWTAQKYGFCCFNCSPLTIYGIMCACEVKLYSYFSQHLIKAENKPLAHIDGSTGSSSGSSGVDETNAPHRQTR